MVAARQTKQYELYLTPGRSEKRTAYGALLTPGMPRPRLITFSAMVTLLASSSSAFRSLLLRPSHVHALQLARISSKRCHPDRWPWGQQLSVRTGVFMGIETSAGILGLGALTALRFFTSSITPKRLRVVTDIDDTVKSSGNKRILGIPLGGIDAQCESTRGGWCTVVQSTDYRQLL